MEEFLSKYMRGEASPEEKKQILEWVEESPEHRQEYNKAYKLHTLLLWNTQEKNKYTLRYFTIRLLKIASILLIGLTLGYYLFYPREDTVKMQELNVPAGQRAELLLSDGTKVWLNSRSTLRFPDRFVGKKRNVELIGEGYFTVVSNPDSPFIVKTEKHNVCATGTEFNVKAYGGMNHFEAALLHGKISIYSLDQNSEISLVPGQMVQKKQEGLTADIISDYNYFKWREGLFCFENESISGLIEKLQLYYDVTIETEIDSFPDYYFSGKFRISDGVEHVLKVLQLKYKFTYVKNDELNLIVIKETDY